MIDDLKKKISKFFKRKKSDSNFEIEKKKKLIFKIAVAVFLLILLIQGISGKQENTLKTELSSENERIKIELADAGMDTEKHWRLKAEAQVESLKRSFDEQTKKMEELFENKIHELRAKHEEEIKTKDLKLEMTRQELADASLDLKKAASDKNKAKQPLFEESNMQTQEFVSDVEFDIPKPAETYIPPGTFLTGYLSSGITVSTAQSTADTNPTFVTIYIKGRGNLDVSTKLNHKECMINGSAYGDISSERAIIRLENMVCKDNGHWVQSNIAGQVYGPDGFHGVKGKVVDTAQKHMKKALTGEVVKGFSGNLKGSESMVLSSGGMVSTQSQGAKQLFAKGAFEGIGNAGSKYADYFIKLAESYSPSLFVKPAKIDVQITKGFYVGEIGTHKKIKSEKR